MLKEWIVTLRNREDLDSFYDDMETPGGNLFIPDRAVELANRRPISRNTHYMLTDDEVELIRADDRVMGVDLKELIDITTRPCYTITNGEFDKSWVDDASDLNWGLLRHSEENNRSNWGYGGGGTSLQTDNLTITASGKNVDVVIVDGHIDPDHPEFAVNANGSGGSRVNQFNWFSLTNQVTGGSNGTYVYDRSGSYVNSIDQDDNNHGCHCAGTVAGNTQGWARDATIYNISPYGTNPNSLSSSVMWDYIRAWHNSKPINPETGRRNPTVTNNSYGSSIYTNADSATYGYTTSEVDRVTYRGVDFNPGRSLTQAELQARGFYCPSSSLTMSIPNYFTSRNADMQDAIDDGIIIVVSAGNNYWKIVNSSDQDYNNTYEMTYQGSRYTWYLNRGTGSGAAYAPNINVGATSNETDEKKAPFSNCGSLVDIYAAGEAIQSSVHAKSGDIADPRNSSYNLDKYQGTSMSGPQVAGVLAILAESNPNMTQTQAQEWLIRNANIDKMGDTGADDPMDVASLQGSANRYLRWKNQRQTTGQSYPLRTLSYRPDSGAVYPRRKVKVHRFFEDFTASTDIAITKRWSQGSHTYTTYSTVPSGSGPFPVVIMLHGNGGTANPFLSSFTAQFQNHIRISVQGYSNSWNIAVESSKGPDIEMLRDLIRKVKKYRNVDETKIRIYGLSNGCGLALRAFAEIEDESLDAVVGVISQTNTWSYRGSAWWRPSNHELIGSGASGSYDTLISPVPRRRLLQMNGTSDTVIPYGGGSAMGVTILPAQESAYRFAQTQGYGGSQITPSTWGAYSRIADYGQVVFLDDTVGHAVSNDMRTLMTQWLENDWDVSAP